MNARAIAEAAIASIDVAARVREALASTRASVILAVGKGAPAMTRAALDVVQGVQRTCVVTSEGTPTLGLSGVMIGDHPLPTARSVRAGRALLEAARGADSVVALISGGASSLACVPRVSLADLRAVSQALLDAGAPIAEVNLVRRHLSFLKGGGLARAARGPVRTLIVSDVLGGSPRPGSEDGDAWDVGSGPATPDPTGADDARLVIERWAPALAHVAAALETTFAAADPDAARVVSSVIAAPSDLARAAESVARRAGFSVCEVLAASNASAETLAEQYVSLAGKMSRGQAVLRVAEPSVRLPAERGQGGRAGRLALLAWARGLPEGVELACIASDGVDGSSEAAGACVRGNAPPGAGQALSAFDDMPFLRSHGALVAGTASGINLLDLHVMIRR